MTDLEDLRSDALMHAIALHGTLSEDESGDDAMRLVLAAAVVFQAYIQEGYAAAVRVAENKSHSADVIQLVRP